MVGVLNTVRAYIRERDLICAGERVAVAVSGGADSVALLHALLELRAEMGIVLSVAHVNHGLRGADADQDAAFTAELARAHGIECHLAVRNVAAYAEAHKIGVEAAGRRLRYAFFAELVSGKLVDKVATAHTLDDQAETVLLKVLRGAWLRGLAGIHDKVSATDADGACRVRIIRPLLGVGRPEVLAYLRALSQPWREDASNEDAGFTRNRVRKLLPLLEQEYNPAVRESLAQMAELARAEENYWAEEIARVAPELISPAGDNIDINASGLAKLPLATQRRVLREAGTRVGLWLSFVEVERLRDLLHAGSGSRRQLCAGWQARKHRSVAHSIIRLERNDPRDDRGREASDYQYRLCVPGQVSVPEARCLIRATVVQVAEGQDQFNLLDARRLGTEVTVRNWHPGDRYLPLGEHHEEKLKSYFQRHGIEPAQRLSLPLVVSNGHLAWVCGMPVAAAFALRDAGGDAIRIEAVPFPEAPRG